MMSQSNQGPFHPGSPGPRLQPIVASWFCGTPQTCDQTCSSGCSSSSALCLQLM